MEVAIRKLIFISDLRYQQTKSKAPVGKRFKILFLITFSEHQVSHGNVSRPLVTVWNPGHQHKIFSRIGHQESAISDPGLAHGYIQRRLKLLKSNTFCLGWDVWSCRLGLVSQVY